MTVSAPGLMLEGILCKFPGVVLIFRSRLRLAITFLISILCCHSAKKSEYYSAILLIFNCLIIPVREIAK